MGYILFSKQKMIDAECHKLCLRFLFFQISIGFFLIVRLFLRYQAEAMPSIFDNTQLFAEVNDFSEPF